MESSLETQARAALADRLDGARRDVATVVRYLVCCPVSTPAPVVPVLLAACDCLDEALVRLLSDLPVAPEPPDGPDQHGVPDLPEGSAALDEPADDRQ